MRASEQAKAAARAANTPVSNDEQPTQADTAVDADADAAMAAWLAEDEELDEILREPNEAKRKERFEEMRAKRRR